MLPTRLEGARTHNLQGVTVEFRPGEVVAITGVSGAGKSSLALDTLYAEGQRRFVESFSPYARQFLERLERPPMDRLEPVPAGIAVDRRAPVKSCRPPVGTRADLEPYLVALFTREAVATCPEHGADAVSLDPVLAAERVFGAIPSETVTVTYPLAFNGKEAYLALRDSLAKDGYRRLWIGGRVEDIDGLRPSVAVKAREVHVVVDRLKVTKDEQSRLAASIEQAWARGGGLSHVWQPAAGDAPCAHVLRSGLGCPVCARPLALPETGLFSYDSPVGACRTCRGFGRTIGVDLRKVIPDPSLSVARGAIRPWSGKSTSWERGQVEQLCKRHGVPVDKAWGSLSVEEQRVVLEGDGGFRKGKFPGVLGWFKWLETRTYKMHVWVFLARYRSYDPCAECGGKRLGVHALSYRVGGLDIASWRALEIRDVE